MEKVTFTLPKEVSIDLPLNIVAKKNGYLKGLGKDGPFTVDCGPRFCEINKIYILLNARPWGKDNNIEFEVMTETVLEDGSAGLTPHYMDYEFLVEHFHVTF